MIVLQLRMMPDPLVIAGNVVRARRDDQAAARSDVLPSISSEQFPSRKRIVQSPVIPARMGQGRRMNELTQLGCVSMRNSVRVN